MNKIIFLFLLSTIYLHSQTSITIVLKDFNVLKVYNGIDINLIKSDKQKIVIAGEKSDKVKIRYKGNTLKVLMKFPEILADGKVKATLYYNKKIDVIDANENSMITGKDLIQEKIEFNAQEGSFINFVIKSKYLFIKSTSGGVIKLKGQTDNQVVNLQLGGVYLGYDLKAKFLTTIKSGTGSNAKLNVGETLDAKVSFGGTIFYKGHPKVIREKKVIGATIESRN